MNRKIIIGLSVVLFGALIVIGVQQYQLYQTKQFSPAEKAFYRTDRIEIEVNYSRPSKKGREIFGRLVPYGEWWRTGANEATQISLSRDVQFETGRLRAGDYSIITIPNETEWIVIFNERIPEWGTSYYPESDVLRVTAPVQNLPEVIEFFTIDFTEEDGHPAMIFAWDQIKVTVPFDVL